MKTRVYIDGANFYFGLLKNHPEWKWLDLKGLVALLVRSDHEIDAIRYFTSYIKTHPYDHAATERQNVYLQGIEAFGGVEIVFGKYNKNKTYLPPVEGKCLDCDATRNGLIRVMKFEEKRTDVNIASHMLVDAADNAYDCAILISGDSDLTTPVKLCVGKYGKCVGVINPQRQKCRTLEESATFYKHIRETALAASQFPAVLHDATGTFHKPARW